MTASLHPRSRRRRPLATYLMAAPAIAVLGVAMVAAVLGLPDGPAGLTREIAARVDESGVSHPVTAVLLNLRAYDTWLEVVALLITAIAALITREAALGPPEGSEGAARDLVVSGLVRRLLSVLVLVGVFVLALGTSAPGGAFQAGALLAAGLLLLHLVGFPLTRLLSGWIRELLLVVGSLAFLVAALAAMAAGGRALEFAPAFASLVILAIEIAVTLSIALTLFVLLIVPSTSGEHVPDTPEGRVDA